MAKKTKPRPTIPDDNSSLLLTYLPATSPTPIQVSTQQTNHTAYINLGLLNTGQQPIYCSEVVIAVPTGTETGALYIASPAPTSSVNTSKWGISSMEFKTGRELGFKQALSDVNYATFTFDCRSANDYLINYDLVFGLQGQVNQTTGDIAIQIMETTGTDPKNMSQKTGSLTLTKYTPQFYLENFVSAVPTAPTQPVSEFGNGADILFEWESNGTFFQVYEKNNPVPIFAGTQTTFKLAGGVARDTTFILVAMMTFNPATGKPQSGFAPIYLYETLTVTITNPDLTPKSSNISGNASVGGTLGVSGNTSLANANVSGTLGVSGQSNLGNAQVGGALGVSGTSNLANAIVGGTLSASGNSTLSGTAINGALGVSGAATLNGGLYATNSPIGMLTGAQSVSPATYSANTDGFVVGVVAGASNVNQLCYTFIYGGNSDGVSVRSLGGNVAAFDTDWTKWSGNNQNSFMFPVRKGTSWWVSVWNPSTNQTNAPTTFYWIPMGRNSSSSTLERIGDAPEIKSPLVHRVPQNADKKLRQLVAIIETIVGKPIERELRKQLLSVLTSLQTEDYVNEEHDEG